MLGTRVVSLELGPCAWNKRRVLGTRALCLEQGPCAPRVVFYELRACAWNKDRVLGTRVVSFEQGSCAWTENLEHTLTHLHVDIGCSQPNVGVKVRQYDSLEQNRINLARCRTKRDTTNVEASYKTKQKSKSDKNALQLKVKKIRKQKGRLGSIEKVNLPKDGCAKISEKQ